jgi:hypothetical protein
VALVALAAAGAAIAQERFGTITGTVKDPQGLALPGVSVTVTNNETKRQTTVVTDTEGIYFARALEPGRYTVRFELQGFSPREAPNVLVTAAESSPVDASLAIGAVTEAVQVLAEVSLIDPNTTARQRSIPAEQFEVIPKGRSFQSLATALPSVNAGELEGGVQVNGASAGENMFTVDGVPVISLIHGNQRQDAVFEYLQEVQLRTTGLEAEYGGALGGVITAVTRSGGNRFTGSAYEYFTSDWLRSHNGIAQRLIMDPVTQNSARIVQDEAQSFNLNEFGGSLGGPVVRDRLFFFGALSPRIEKLTRNYTIPTAGQVFPVERDRRTYSSFGKINYSPTNRLQTSFSALWTPDKATGVPISHDGFEPNTTAQTATSLQARNTLGYEIPQWSMSYTGDYTIANTAIASLRGGYMRDNYRDTGVDASQTFEYGTTSVGLAGVPLQFQQAAGFQNLPRIEINEKDITTRTFFDLSLTKVASFGGQHTFKGGFGFTRLKNDVDISYPNGGYVVVYWDQTYTSDVPGVGSGRGPYGYYEINDIGTRGVTSANILSLFVQDSWRPTSRLTLNLGARFEDEKIPSFRPEIQETAIHFDWSEKISPRLGLAFDLFGDGRSKLSASYGRYYDWTKYELVRGTFGGDIWTTRYRSLDDPDPTKLTRANLTGRNLWDSSSDSFKDHRVPSFGDDVVDPNIKPMSSEAFNVGFEQQVGRTVLGLNFVRTNLIRTIEDIGTLVNGSEVYIYGNPGEGIATTAITTGATEPFVMPKPKREYTALEFTANRRLNNNWFVSGSYVWSKLFGNYTGLVNTDEVTAPGRAFGGAQEAFGQRTRPGSNATRAWDLDEYMFDSNGNFVYGRLPTDRPHVLKLFGSYVFDFGTNVGLNFYAGSGTPASKTVWSVFNYGIFADGRGSLGRTPTITQTNLLLNHDFRLGGGTKRLRLEFNALNVFNQREARHIFEAYNRLSAAGSRLVGSALRISSFDLTQGYDYEALLAATPDAQKPASANTSGFRDPRFGLPDIFNPGFEGRFMVRFMF